MHRRSGHDQRARRRHDPDVNLPRLSEAEDGRLTSCPNCNLHPQSREPRHYKRPSSQARDRSPELGRALVSRMPDMDAAEFARQ